MSADCGCGPETYTRGGVTYAVHHTDAYVGELGTRRTRRAAERMAVKANAERIGLSVRFEVRHAGWFRWAVIALQNQLQPVR